MQMRWLATILLALAPSGLIASDALRLNRLQQTPAEASIESVRALQEVWLPVPELALRRQSGPSWWRISTAPAHDADEAWVLALKEAYDAEIVVYAPPDYAAHRLATFDSSTQQLGSRHRLALALAPESMHLPVFIALGQSRGQPIRLSLTPLTQYLAEDTNRVRITSALLSAQVLLGLVAAIYAFALRRRMLLLFSAWVASSVLYLMVMSGEITALLPGSTLLPHAMRLNGIAINVGMICAYAFVMWFLDIPRHYPRLRRVFEVLLVACAVTLAVQLVDPGNLLFLNINNLLTMGLGALALGTGVARALAGSPQGWFYLIGWGAVSGVGLYRASLFLRYEGTPDWLEVAHPLISTLGALVLVLATARAARYAEREMHAAREVARIDPLTGLANRGQLDISLAALLQANGSSAQGLCVMFLDLDHFKAINDNFGHGVGDDCLVACAKILRGELRGSDLLARYGGEEFVVVLPGAALAHAVEIAESLRTAIQRNGSRVAGRPVELTVSIGLAEWHSGESMTALLERADLALYRAKHKGRNRVETAGIGSGVEAALAG